MNKQDLVERAGLIKAQMEQTQQQFVTLQAHLNECNFWLGKFDELEAQVKNEPVVESNEENANGGQEVDSESTPEVVEGEVA